MKIIIEIEDGLVGYQFKKGKNKIKFEDLSRVEQIRILNSFANGYNYLSAVLRRTNMKERNKPTQSWIAKSKDEIENADRLLAERIEKVKEIRVNKLLYQDSEAFKVGYEAGFAMACDMLYDFAKRVYEMRKRQKAVERAMVESDDYSELTILVNSAEDWEAEVDSWIRMNYPHLMED